MPISGARSSTGWSIIARCSRACSARSRSRATAPRALRRFPAPRSLCGPWPGRPPVAHCGPAARQAPDRDGRPACVLAGPRAPRACPARAVAPVGPMRAVQRLAPQQRGDLTRLLARVGLLQDPLLVLRAVAAPLRALDELWVGRRRARSRWPRSRSCSFERSFSAQSPSCPLSYQQCTAKLTTVDNISGYLDREGAISGPTRSEPPACWSGWSRRVPRGLSVLGRAQLRCST